MEVFQAISDPNRRAILDLLRQKTLSVQEVGANFDVTVGAVSQHLGALHDAGLVTRRKEGRYRYYGIGPGALRDVHDWTGRYSRFWEDRLDRLGAYLDDTP